MIDPKVLTLHKLEAGGHEVLDEDGKSLGFISHKHLMAHVRQYHEGFDQLSLCSLSDALPIDREVHLLVNMFMKETGASIGVATTEVLRSNEKLARKYHKAHQKEIII